jgi:hypothetical protein
MKLCFVSVNSPREPYLLDEPRNTGSPVVLQCVAWIDVYSIVGAVSTGIVKCICVCPYTYELLLLPLVSIVSDVGSLICL